MDAESLTKLVVDFFLCCLAIAAIFKVINSEGPLQVFDRAHDWLLARAGNSDPFSADSDKEPYYTILYIWSCPLCFALWSLLLFVPLWWFGGALYYYVTIPLAISFVVMAISIPVNRDV